MGIHATVTSKGQMTIPAEFRDAMGLKEGDKVTCELLPDGSMSLRKAATFEDLRGIVKLDRHISDEELDGWIADMRGRSTDR
jgi:AbrB family looped-hinge helix DNA binding protein